MKPELFKRLGIADQMKNKSKRIESEYVGAAARTFIEYLKSPVVRPAILKSGLQPVPAR